jgi:hypothetical protein
VLLHGFGQALSEEAPSHPASVDSFWIDRHPVTNEEFARFVHATGYVTLAERAPDPKDYPGAKPEMLVPASVVFKAPKARVDMGNHYNWWTYVPGANWRHPGGPSTTLKSKGRHPVVHIAYEDAGGLCEMGAQGAAERGGVGVCRARRARWRRLCVGRRVHADGPHHGQHLARRVSLHASCATATRTPRRSAPSRQTATACST